MCWNLIFVGKNSPKSLKGSCQTILGPHFSSHRNYIETFHRVVPPPTPCHIKWSTVYPFAILSQRKKSNNLNYVMRVKRPVVRLLSGLLFYAPVPTCSCDVCVVFGGLCHWFFGSISEPGEESAAFANTVLLFSSLGLLGWRPASRSLPLTLAFLSVRQPFVCLAVFSLPCHFSYKQPRKEVDIGIH